MKKILLSFVAGATFALVSSANAQSLNTPHRIDSFPSPGESFSPFLSPKQQETDRWNVKAKSSLSLEGLKKEIQKSHHQLKISTAKELFTIKSKQETWYHFKITPRETARQALSALKRAGKIISFENDKKVMAVPK